MSDEPITPEVVDAASTDVAVAEPKAELVQSTGVEPPEAMLWRHFRKVALSLCHTAFVPEGFRGKPDETMAALAYGYELGLGPMQSLQSLDVIKGKPTMKPEMMRSLIRARGHSLVRTEATADHVTFHGVRIDNGDEETVTFTWAMAEAMQLTSKDNWRKMPRAMLTARCTAEIARSLFSDVIMGASYTPEELDGETPPEVDYVEYEERKPSIQIVTSNPQRAGHVVRSATLDSTGATDMSDAIADVIDSVPSAPMAKEWGWHTVVEDGQEIAVCNRCIHPVLSHSIARRGCFTCACNYAMDAPSGTMKTVGAASPDQGEQAPAGQPVNDTGEDSVEGAPPSPGIANVGSTANPERDDVGSVPGQTEVQPPATSHPGGPSADPALLPQPATEAKFRRVMIALKENKLGDDARHTIVAFVTGSRTTSSRQITDAEAELILNLCGQVRLDRLRVEQHDGEWKILVIDDAGRRFLESIERSIAPTRGRHGRVPVDESTITPISEAEQAEVI